MFFNKDKEKKETKANINAMISAMPDENKREIPSDILGSYTGTAKDGDAPTQDADDI